MSHVLYRYIIVILSNNVQISAIQLMNNALSVNIYAWVKFDIFSSAIVVV